LIQRLNDMEEIVLSRFKMFIGKEVTIKHSVNKLSTGILESVNVSKIILNDGEIIDQNSFIELYEGNVKRELKKSK